MLCPQVGLALYGETGAPHGDSLVTGLLRERLPHVRIEVLGRGLERLVTLCPWLNSFKATFFNSLVVSKASSAANRSIGSTTGSTITEKAPTRAFSWLKAATTAFTFNTLLRHYAKQALTPRSLNVKLGPRRKGHKGRAFWLA